MKAELLAVCLRFHWQSLFRVELGCVDIFGQAPLSMLLSYDLCIEIPSVQINTLSVGDNWVLQVVLLTDSFVSYGLIDWCLVV